MEVKTYHCQSPVPGLMGAVQDEPGASVHVYIPGTTTHVSIFAQDGVTPQSNPVIADATTANAVIAAPNGAYDIQIVSPDGSQSVTIPKVLFSDSADDLSINSVTITGPDAAAADEVPTLEQIQKRMNLFAFQGNWNASTNSPDLTATGNKNEGWVFKVSVAGTTSLSGIASWAVGDLAYYDGSAWGKIESGLASVYAAIANVRIKLLADTTYYVRTDGSDSNTGLANTSGGAFLTLQKAVDTVSALDHNNHNVTIQVADGTYSTGTSNVGIVANPFVNGSKVTLQGNTTTPGNCILVTTTATAFSFTDCTISIGGFKLQSTSGNLISILHSRLVISGAMEFGATTGTHINVGQDSVLSITANCTISGGAARHLLVPSGSRIEYSSSVTITLSGTPAFSTAFVQLQRGSTMLFTGVTVSGSATGVRYILDDGCDIVAASGTDFNSLLPGNAAGYVSASFTGYRTLRNLLINAQGRLQEGTSGAIADDTYGLHNRWYALTQLASVTPSTISDVQDGLPYMMRITNGASAQRLGYAQIIEGVNCRHLRNRRVTLSGTVRPGSYTGVVRFGILEWTGTEDAVTSDVVNNWTSGSLTAGGFFLGSNLTVTALSLITPGAAPLVNFAVSGTLSSSFNNLIVFIWSGSQIDPSDTLDLVAQLEAGNNATVQDKRPLPLEKQLCSRYYQSKTVQSQNGNRHIPLLPMRTTPSVTVSVGSAAHITPEGFELSHTTQADCTVIANAEL